MAIDLHVHSTSSDGRLSPAELVDYALQKGLRAFALTDHDTIHGISLAEIYATKKGIEFIPGVEISSLWEPGQLHVLGYYINPANKVLTGALNSLRKARDERNPKMIKLLNQLGFSITIEDVKRIAGDGVIGRPHIARALLEAGYINDYKEAFDKYISPGLPAYVPKERIEPAEAVFIIKSAGGIPVIAHPKYLGYNGNELKEKLSFLKDIGFEGIEAIYPDHSIEETNFFISIGKKLGLIITGGSDFHSLETKGNDLGCVNVPDEYLCKLKERLNKKNR